jgi:hypothetical protein
MMTQNKTPAPVNSSSSRPIIMWLLIVLGLFLIFFIYSNFQDSNEFNHSAREFQSYVQFTDPDYGILPSNIGYGSSASISTTGDSFSMKYVVNLGLNSRTATQTVFSRTIAFKERISKWTFDQYGANGFHRFDSSMIETLKSNTNITLDISFIRPYPLDEIRALGLKYKCFISWVAAPGESLEQFGFPGTNEVFIRELMANALSFQDHLKGHQAFKASVRYAFVNGITVYGIRVSGSSPDLLNLLNDRPVQSVEVVQLNGKPVVE